MKPSWKIGLALAGIVLVSLGLGVDLGFHWEAFKARRRSNPGAWNQSIMRLMEHRLKLSPEQKVKVQARLDERVRELSALRDETLRKTNQTLEQLIAEVNAELTPEQQATFAQLVAKRGETTLDALKVSVAPAKSTSPRPK